MGGMPASESMATARIAAETGRVREAQALGAGRYLRKPYTLESLGLAVKQELAS